MLLYNIKKLDIIIINLKKQKPYNTTIICYNLSIIILELRNNRQNVAK